MSDSETHIYIKGEKIKFWVGVGANDYFDYYFVKYVENDNEQAVITRLPDSNQGFEVRVPLNKISQYVRP